MILILGDRVSTGPKTSSISTSTRLYPPETVREQLNGSYEWGVRGKRHEGVGILTGRTVSRRVGNDTLSHRVRIEWVGLRFPMSKYLWPRETEKEITDSVGSFSVVSLSFIIISSIVFRSLVKVTRLCLLTIQIVFSIVNRCFSRKVRYPICLPRRSNWRSVPQTCSDLSGTRQVEVVFVRRLK